MHKRHGIALKTNQTCKFEWPLCFIKADTWENMRSFQTYASNTIYIFSEGYLFNSPQKAIAYFLCIGNYIKH